MKRDEFTGEDRQQLLDRVSEFERERNLRLHAEESMREALNRFDDFLARLMVFRDFATNELDEKVFIEHCLEAVIESYETEIAAFFVAIPQGQLQLAGGFGLDNVDDQMPVSTAKVPADKTGLLGKGASPDGIADLLNLHEGMYCTFKGKDAQLGGLIVTGNTEAGVGVYHAPTEEHLSLFVILGAHIGALWNNLSLMKQIQKHTQELNQANIKLAQAQEEADAANQAKSNFLANVSHELRTPMNHIMGFIDIVLTSEIEEKQKGFLQKARSSSNDLLTIINNIISFSQMDKDELFIEATDFWLDDVCHDLVSFFIEQAGKKGLKLEMAEKETVPMGLIGDPRRLTQILNNLIDNAIKFTQSGSINIERKLLKQKGNRVTIKFAVRDTGIGISEEIMPDLFKAFTQGDASSTRAYGGTGVGLAISKKLTELMGGKIWAESTPGKGSSFYFTADFTLSQTAQPKKRAVPVAKTDNKIDLNPDGGLSENPDKKPAADPADLLELLLNLQSHVKRKKPKPSKAVLKEITSFTWPDNYIQPLEKLGKLVSGYKFKDARVVLEELITSLKKG